MHTLRHVKPAKKRCVVSSDSNQDYDRLAMLVENIDNITLVGFIPANEGEPTDLESGFPCEGRWRIDYVDHFDMAENIEEYVMSVANAMWGTVILDNGDITTDSLLTWAEITTGAGDHFFYGVRNAEAYEQACVEAFTMSDAT